ncbi:MAG: cytochrome c biogenesis protein CcdA [Gemmatimonadota bacterium]|jgi:thiol:disulfide interchange protein DsbD
MRALRSAVAAGIALLAWVGGAYAQETAAHWTLSVDTGTRIEAGSRFTARAVAAIDPGWHMYSLTQAPGGPIALAISAPDDSPFRIDGNIIGPLPVTAFDPNFGFDTETYEDRAEFELPITASPEPAGEQTLAIDVRFQTCNDRYCLPPATERLTVALTAGEVVTAGASSGATEAGASGPPVAASAVPDLAAESTASTLPRYLALAALMGLLSLLTPCVFPMVPITVSYFTSRAESKRSRAVSQAVVYGLGIVLTSTLVGFLVAIGFGAAGLNRFAADPWLNLGITALFVAFALNLFGVYELVLPARVLNLGTSTRSGRYGGALLMGLVFTLTSFTCTAPFLGTLLVVASQGDWQWPLFGLIAFSSVFALPFVGLAIAPQLVASLPRAGGWLLSVKATMGLLELAAAMKFLSNADLIWGWGIFTRNVVIAIWVAIGLVLATYLAGTIRLGHATRLGRPGPARIVVVGAALLLTVWLGSGLGGRRLGEVESFLPPADPSATSGELSWIINEYDTALAQAKQENRPVLVDFTGYTCTNCRWMEANMFPRSEVALEMDRFVRVRLYTDGRGEPYQSFQAMQRDVFGTVALPYYAVLKPDGEPLVAFGGLTRDPRAFVSFLRRGFDQSSSSTGGLIP